MSDIFIKGWTCEYCCYKRKPIDRIRNNEIEKGLGFYCFFLFKKTNDVVVLMKKHWNINALKQ